MLYAPKTHMLAQGPLETKNYETFRIGDTIITDAKTVRTALPGDLVAVDGAGHIVIERRAKHTALVGTIEMASCVKYGFTSRGIPIYLFVPWKESYPPFYVIFYGQINHTMPSIKYFLEIF